MVDKSKPSKAAWQLLNDAEKLNELTAGTTGLDPVVRTATECLYSAVLMFAHGNATGAQDYFRMARNEARMAFGLLEDAGWRALATKISIIAACWCHREDQIAAKHLGIHFVKMLYGEPTQVTYDAMKRAAGSAGVEKLSVVSACTEVMAAVLDTSAGKRRAKAFAERTDTRLNDARQVFGAVTEMNEWLLFSDPTLENCKHIRAPVLELEVPVSEPLQGGVCTNKAVRMGPASWYAYYCRFRYELMTLAHGPSAVFEVETLVFTGEPVVALYSSPSGNLVSLGRETFSVWALANAAISPERELSFDEAPVSGRILMTRTPGTQKLGLVSEPLNASQCCRKQLVMFHGEQMFVLEQFHGTGNCSSRFFLAAWAFDMKRFVFSEELSLPVDQEIKSFFLFEEEIRFVSTAGDMFSLPVVTGDGGFVLFLNDLSGTAKKITFDGGQPIVEHLVVSVTTPTDKKAVLVAAFADRSLGVLTNPTPARRFKEAGSQDRQYLSGEATCLAGDRRTPGMFFTGTSSGEIAKWKLSLSQAGIVLTRLATYQNASEMSNVAELLFNGRRLVTVCRQSAKIESEDSVVRFWDTENDEFVTELPLMHDLRTATLARSGELITSSGAEGKIIVW